MKALMLAALVVSAAARAEDADVLEVAQARIATPANDVVDVQGGIYLSPGASAQVAKKVVQQEQEIKTLKSERMHPVAVIAIAVVGAIAAGVGGFFAGKAAK